MTQAADALQPDRHSFIVRVWREASVELDSSQWRGSIEHVPSGQRIHFVSLDALSEFVGRYLTQPQHT